MGRGGRYKRKRKLPMYFGSYERGDEVIKMLESRGGVNTLELLGKASDNLYYIDGKNIIRSINHLNVLDIFSKVFELKTLPEKDNTIEFTLSAERFDRMIVKEHFNSKWSVDIFTRYIDSDIYSYEGLHGVYHKALPFLESTKRFIGIITNPDEVYKFKKIN